MATVLSQLRNHICTLQSLVSKEELLIEKHRQKTEKLGSAIEKAEALNEILEGLDIPQDVKVVRRRKRKIRTTDVLRVLQNRGGTATIDDLKNALNVKNGQRFIGVRSSLIRQGLVQVSSDGVYSLKEAADGN